MVQNVNAEEIQKESWYNYDKNTKQWANAKSADGSLWVWIPRFAYKITYDNGKKKTDFTEDQASGIPSGNIEIVFLKGTTNEPVDGSDVTQNDIVRANSENTEGKYVVHPAFTDESNTNFVNGGWDAEIPGFWVAKFEAAYAGNGHVPSSATDSPVGYRNPPVTNFYEESNIPAGTKIKYPIFKSNKPSFNNISIEDSFELCKKLTSSGNPYGFTSKVDSHLAKNSEWGAVAYLGWYACGTTRTTTDSVKVKDALYTTTAFTGYGGASKTNGVEYKDFNDLLKGNGYNWTSPEGMTTSTTKNLTGVYDMQGGLLEYTAGVLSDHTGPELSSSRMVSHMEKPSKYVTIYALSDREGSVQNFADKGYRNWVLNNNVNRLGEGIWETSNAHGESWSMNGGRSRFISSNLPYTTRGGYYDDTQLFGMTDYYSGDGLSSKGFGFRAVLVTF